MAKYRVDRKEVYVSTMLIEADSPEEAKELVREGEGIEVNLDYYCLLGDYDVDDEYDVYLDEEIT